MKNMVLIITALLSFDAYACQTESFLNGIANLPQQIQENNEKAIKESFSQSDSSKDSKIIGIQDTGKRYRCACYDYLVKVQDSKNANSVYILEYTIENGIARAVQVK